MPTEVENDPFFQLLTDALRAGPASPPWREAVAKLREQGGGGGEGGDEYRLLIDARENLEIGKAYREVRPGPEFTRKVLSGVEDSRQPRGGRRVPIAGVVAILAAIVLIGVVAYVTHIITGGQGTSGAVDELAGRYFPTTVASVNFTSPLGNDFRRIGSLELVTTGGLRLGPGEKSTAGTLGGGLVFANPLSPDEPFATEAQIRPGNSPDQLAELFVSTSPDFTADRATAPHELVWLIAGQRQKVVLDGHEVTPEKPITRIPGQPTLDVQIKMNKDVAIVEVDHQRIWSGQHSLGDGPRYVGVRILTTAPGVAGKPDEPAIIDWKILR